MNAPTETKVKNFQKHRNKLWAKIMRARIHRCASRGDITAEHLLVCLDRIAAAELSGPGNHGLWPSNEDPDPYEVSLLKRVIGDGE